MALHAKTLEWLMEGDVSVQYQTRRDLLNEPGIDLDKLQRSISENGWGREFISRRDPETGLWGGGVYSPKWISTHYTLLDLKNMGVHPETKDYVEGSRLLLDRIWRVENGVNKGRRQDVCVSAMVMSICCYAGIQSHKLFEIADYLLDKQYTDGGWNCNWYSGDKHSSLHTTLSVLEAFRDYIDNGYTYRIDEIKKSIPPAAEFILKKRLFRSVHTGEVIHKSMTMLSYPCRWKYDILRCMDYFRSADLPYDERMEEALDIIVGKMRKNGRWPVQQKYAGLVHFDMEHTGDDSRWNTLRVLRVLKKYRPQLYSELTL